MLAPSVMRFKPLLAVSCSCYSGFNTTLSACNQAYFVGIQKPGMAALFMVPLSNPITILHTVFL